MLPIHPLDGGRIVTAISRWLWVVGLIGGLIVILYLKAIIFLFFWGLFAWELYKKYVRKDKKKEKEQETTLVISTPEANFIETGVPIPAESHRRILPFIQSCDVQTKSEDIHLYYPGVGHLSSVPFWLGIVKRATLIETKREHDMVVMKLLLTIVEYSENQSPMFQKEEYYQVPSGVRWKYGLAYFGLAAFLGWMMLVTYSQFTPVPLVG